MSNQNTIKSIAPGASPRAFFSVPHVIKRTSDGERVYDLESRLLEDRIIMVNGEITPDSAQIVMEELLYLSAMDSKKDITMYINSPGGTIVDGLAIYDTMQFVKNDIATIVVGMAASMGSILCSGGKKGKRYALPNSEIMIHQPLGGAQGQASDIQIVAKHIESYKEKLAGMLALHAGLDYSNPDVRSKILNDIDRDNWLSAEAAVEYGLIDKVISSPDDLRPKKKGE